MLYVNERWKHSWGGRTWFRDDNGNIMFSTPKPNWGVFFPGWMDHYAESPTKKFKGLRMTIAWKFLPNNIEFDRDGTWP